MPRLLSSLLLITIILAILTSAAPTRRSFKIPRVRRSASYKPSGPAALQKAYSKYGWTANGANNSASEHGTSELVATSGTESGNVAATAEESDQEFVSPVLIGGQTIMMDFDTGSSDLWVFSSGLPPSTTQSHTIFDPSQSKTFQTMQGSTWSIGYGDGSGASGIVGTDTVNVGGATVTGQAVELATSVASTFASNPFSSGLLGLGFDTNNQVKPNAAKTFFSNLQGSLPQAVFTANLKHATVGNYEFGAIDNSQFTGNVAYTPVDSSNGFWQIPSTSFTVGSGMAQGNAGATAIADTGTSLILATSTMVKAYYAQVSGAVYDSSEAGGGAYIFPCSSSLPDLGLAIGNHMASIPGALINYGAAVENGYCYGGLQTSPPSQPFQVYGDIFFKANFVVFDGGNTMLGFAPHA